MALTVESLSQDICRIRPKNWSFAFVLGSVVTGRLHEESDIDIAIMLDADPDLVTGKQSYVRAIGLQDYKKLSELSLDTAFCGRKVDWIVLNNADPIICWQILEKGKLIYEREPGASHVFRAESVEKYLDFKQSRKIVENAYLKRGIHD
jgi:uncharacterized protein